MFTHCSTPWNFKNILTKIHPPGASFKSSARTILVAFIFSFLTWLTDWLTDCRVSAKQDQRWQHTDVTSKRCFKIFTKLIACSKGKEFISLNKKLSRLLFLLFVGHLEIVITFFFINIIFPACPLLICGYFPCHFSFHSFVVCWCGED